MNQHHQIIIDRLDDLLDDAVEQAERERLLEHLAGCAACEAEMTLRVAFRAEVDELPREIQPPRDLWPAIAGRIAEAGSPTAGGAPVIPIGRAARVRRWTPLMLAAAASLTLVALSSGLTAWVLRDQVEIAGAPAPASAPAVAERATTALVAFEPAEQEFLSTLEVLGAAFQARRSQLSPETVRAVEENLLIIDAAIEETRAALAADAAGSDLTFLLSGVYRRKVELLEHAVNAAART